MRGRVSILSMRALPYPTIEHICQPAWPQWQGTKRMTLPLDKHLKIGIQTIHRRTEPATAPWLPKIDELAELVTLVDSCGYDSLWVGDHIAFAVSILDPLLQLAQAAVVSRRLTLGTNVYLLPLRHPGPVAKQIASLDHLCEGRLIFVPQEFAVSGVNLNERGGRL